MIKSIGTDIVELSRIATTLKKFPNFPKRILTDKEMELYETSDKISFLAGRFCAKESVSKALGKGIGKLSWKMIEILPDLYGKPIVTLRDEGNFLVDGEIFLSISHEKQYVISFAIWEV